MAGRDGGAQGSLLRPGWGDGRAGAVGGICSRGEELERGSVLRAGA